MKKITILSFATLMLGAVSCNDSGNGDERTLNFNVPCINIVTMLNDNSTVASNGIYTFDLNISKMTGTVSATGLIVDNTAMDFTTNEATYKSSGYNVFFENTSATVNGNSSYSITNGTFLATPAFWYPQDFIGNPPSPYMVVASFNIGNLYSVKTYPTDAVYMGTTKTSYTMQGMQQNAENKNIFYQVKINPTEKKANLAMYNAKFSDSPNEPTKTAIYVKNLDVEFSPSGITITGENVIPDVLEGSSTTPNERYVFNTISFKTTNEKLNECQISYEVAGMYFGEFTGNYIMNNEEGKFEPYI